MNKIPSTPFKRNNYYYGKFLTAEDFNAEQNYINDKRSLLNRNVFCSGVVTGLNLNFDKNENSIILTSGMAINLLGHEITVGTDVEVEVSSLKEHTDKTTAYLYIEYKEELIDEIQIITGEKKKNYLQEGYIMGFEFNPPSYPSFKSILLQTNNVSIIGPSNTVILKRTIPKWINSGDIFSVTISIENPLDGMKVVESIDDNFTIIEGISEDGEIDFPDGVTEKSYVLQAKNITATGIIRLESISDNNSGITYTAPEEQELSQIDIDTSIYAKIAAEYISQPVNSDDDTRVFLGQITYSSDGSTVTIDSVEPMPSMQYVYGNTLLYNLICYEESRNANHNTPITYEEINNLINQKLVSYEETVNDLINQKLTGKTGILNFPVIGPNEEFVSDKIDPELGPGLLDVTLGIVSNNGNIQYGDLHEFTGIYLYSIIYPEEGKFQIAAKAKNMPSAGISVKWIAAISHNLDKGEAIYIPSTSITSKSLHFGGNTYADFTQTTFEKTFTFEAWVKINNAQSSGIFYFNSVSSPKLTVSLNFYEDNTDTRMQFIVLDSCNEAAPIKYLLNTKNLLNTKKSYSFPIDEWVHVALVADLDSKNILLYWNETSVLCECPSQHTYESDNTSQYYFGKSSWDPSDTFFKGWMTDIRIWNIKRSNTDIINNMNLRLSGKEPGLAAYFPVIEGSGNTLHDLSGNNHTAEIHGNIDWT